MATRTTYRSKAGGAQADGAIPIASMRRRMVIETPVETPDGAGGWTQLFQPLATVWASLEWLGGDERWREGGFEQAGRWRITMRWRAGITAGMRLKDDTRLFDIRASADPDGGGRRLVCLCEEISP
jgi:SPP1 family predicted phage head-tail adaptor